MSYDAWKTTEPVDPYEEPDERLSEDTHREIRSNEFYGFCLGFIRNERRLFPEHRIGRDLWSTYSTLLICGLDEALTAHESCVTMWDYMEEFGETATAAMILSAVREVERES